MAGAFRVHSGAVPGPLEPRIESRDPAGPWPAPPWHTRGRAWLQPYLVDPRSPALPPGFEPVAAFGRTIGLLGLIEYVPPSPLVYAELVWIPCLVRAGGRRAAFVDRMFVDDDTSLAAGRAMWALPKQRARFEISDRTARVVTADGAELELDLARRGPTVRAPLRASTLQLDRGAVIRFLGSGAASIASGGLRVRAARGVDGWAGFASARRVPGAGVALTDFAITMHPPRRFDGG